MNFGFWRNQGKYQEENWSEADDLLHPIQEPITNISESEHLKPPNRLLDVEWPWLFEALGDSKAAVEL